MNELIYNLAVWLDDTEWSRMLHESYYMYNWVESTHVLTLMVSLGMLFLIDPYVWLGPARRSCQPDSRTS